MEGKMRVTRLGPVVGKRVFRHIPTEFETKVMKLSYSSRNTIPDMFVLFNMCDMVSPLIPSPHCLNEELAQNVIGLFGPQIIAP